MRNRTAKVVTLLAVFACSLQIAANPFMGGESGTGGNATKQASPVRAAAADQNLVAKQASLRESLGNYFYEWKESGSQNLFRGIIGVAFRYCILHAIGPGHRKTVIFSLYLARKAPAREPAGTGLTLALVLSLTLDKTGIGILAVFAMSVGMSIPIIAGLPRLVRPHGTNPRAEKRRSKTCASLRVRRACGLLGTVCIRRVHGGAVCA